MVNETEIAHLIQDHYQLRGQWKALPGEYDLNYRLNAEQGTYIVKLLQTRPDLPALTELQYLLGERLKMVPSTLSFPQLIPTTQGHYFLDLHGEESNYTLRIFTWLEGRLWADVEPHGSALLQDAGAALGNLSVALHGFDHPAAHRSLKWDITQPEWAANRINAISDPVRQTFATRLWENFRAIQPYLTDLTWAINYFDANDYNVIVNTDLLSPRVTGMIDYGDVLWNPVISDLALGITYLTLEQEDPLEAATHLVHGYHQVRPLNEKELGCLYGLVCARLLISVVNSAINQQEAPDNEYLQVSDAPAWRSIQKWLQHHPDFILYTFRAAVGMEPCPSRSAFDHWLASDPMFSPVVAIDSGKLVPLDLSLTNAELGGLDNINDIKRFVLTIQQLLADKNATAGYGGYLETRAFYTTAEYVKSSNLGPVWRTVHLGLDLWAEAGTPVYAPWPGLVYQVANNPGAKDYGPTVILKHVVHEALTFYTLYGHLSTSVLDTLQIGQSVAAGQQIATFGHSGENGGWPPHLHMQVMLNPFGSRGDFPGVALPDQLSVWGSVCPDPAQLCGLNFPTSAANSSLSASELVNQRKKWLGPNLSLAYQPQPLLMVRGEGTYLIDHQGRKYLDTVNNVAHVGHEHPRVVKAGQRQMSMINTNTRYLHPSITELAEALIATLPDPLQVVYFVNSGSEANELAYRLTKAATGRRGMAVLEMGYHGNTNTCVDLSSYKFDRRGGTGVPAHVRVVVAPDTYRGTYGSDLAEDFFINSAKTALEELAASHYGVAGMIVEHILSCAGQVPVPASVAQAYANLVRAYGGLFIADEVQTGLGRVGKHFWAFELAQVVPDIVTIGKPFGNGHPLAAVVTTPAVAQAFHNGMEYFNTFGGNPVSCVIGREVLQVIQDEGLQNNALKRGEEIKQGLVSLQKEHPCIGDVRGEGLFIGFELVSEPALKTPATAEASYLAKRARALGVLMSTDGPYDNVLKIKPPLCITDAQVDFLLYTLRKLLAEDFLRRIG